jgi:ParB/RepB/Spo0J family partition protein
MSATETVQSSPPGDVAPAFPHPVAERFERLPIDHVFPSKTNPRGHFDDMFLAELARSIADKGVVQPILVRQRGTKFEIVAGECRYRASKLAKQGTIPAVVRAYTDEQVLELQLIENIHRRDLTPLEQARGYRALIDANPTKHSAESIAVRIGMSPQWVWDRMKLNDLIPEAKKLLDADRLSVGHAILIARQTHANQKRILDPGGRSGGSSSTEQVRTDPEYFGRYRSGLWVRDRGRLEFEDAAAEKAAEQADPYLGLKPVSVRELETWIADHIRFDVAHAAKAQPLTFEGTATAVQTAAAQPGRRGKKVIAITFDHLPADDAKDPNERTYGVKAWRRADGSKKTTRLAWPSNRLVDSPTCEYSVLGVVVAGAAHYGETFQVCIARDKCEVHWKRELQERQKNAKLRASGKTGSAEKREAAAAAREKREAEQRQAKERRWKTFFPALRTAVFAALEKTPATLPSKVYAKVLTFHQLPAGTKVADLPKALLTDALKGQFREYAWQGDEPQLRVWAELLGVDVKACEPEAPQTSGEKAKRKAKPAKRGRKS